MNFDSKDLNRFPCASWSTYEDTSHRDTRSLMWSPFKVYLWTLACPYLGMSWAARRPFPFFAVENTSTLAYWDNEGHARRREERNRLKWWEKEMREATSSRMEVSEDALFVGVVTLVYELSHLTELKTTVGAMPSTWTASSHALDKEHAIEARVSTRFRGIV